MTAQQTEHAVNGHRATGPKRPWYRLRLSTWVATLLAAALWMIVMLAGERVGLPDQVPIRVEHGWPMRFLTREAIDSEYPVPPGNIMFVGKIRGPRLRLWGWDHDGVDFDPAALAADVALAMLSLGALGLFFEWRRRRVRRFWQLSLRDLAIITLAAAGLCAWWGSLYRETQRQAAALQTLDGVMAQAVSGDGLSSTGWHGKCNVQFQTKGDWFLELFWNEETKPRWFGEVVSLKLTTGQDVPDEVVRLIGQLLSLQELSVEVYGGSKRLSDESVQTIAKLRGLRDLTIRRIGGDMSVVGLSDAQVAHLARLADLERLDLSNNHVTDEGLRHLHGLKRLKLLEISNNHITDAGVSELTRSIPGLTVLDD